MLSKHDLIKFTAKSRLAKILQRICVERIFLPEGRLKRTTEESSAHHLHQKTFKNKRRNSFLMSGEILIFSGKSHMKHRNHKNHDTIFDQFSI